MDYNCALERLAEALGSVATKRDAERFLIAARRLGYEVVVDYDSVDLVKGNEIADVFVWQEIMEKTFN